jgi:antitoxin YefM
MLDRYTFTIKSETTEQGIFGEIAEIPDLFDECATMDELKKSLAVQLKEYAEDYASQFQLYSNSPNRKGHLPFIMRVWMADDVNGVVKLFG